MTPQEIQDWTNVLTTVMQINLFEGALMLAGLYAITDWLFGKLSYAVNIWKYKNGEFEFCSRCQCIDCVAESCRRMEREEEGA
jgi:hypothetical protein